MLRGLNHLTIAVSQLDRSMHFYINLLGFTPQVQWDTGAYLALGELWLCLSLDDAKPANDCSHIAFDIADNDFDAFVGQLRQARVVEWKENKSEGNSLYLLDPDGHKLEIHCGDLNSRLESLKTQPYSGLVWH